MPEQLEMQELATGFGFLEGPRLHQGRLLVSDFFRHQVLSVDLADMSTDLICEVEAQPSGLGFTADGALHVVSMLDRRVLRHERGALTTVADLGDLTPHPLNDMVIDSRDRIYVGSFGTTPWASPELEPAMIIRLDPDGGVTVVSRDLNFPNGMVIAADGGEMYVADTFSSRVAVFDVSEEGDLRIRSFVHLGGDEHQTVTTAWASDDFLPDGMAADADGAIWIADANGSGVARLDPTSGEVTKFGVDQLGGERVYALAVGPDGDLLACVAPQIATWDAATVFPGRLARLRRPEAA